MENQINEVVESSIVPVVETPIVKKPFALPYKITCSRCGSVKAVRHEVLLKRLVPFKGTIEERYNEYAKVCSCQNCRRELKNAALEAEFLATK